MKSTGKRAIWLGLAFAAALSLGLRWWVAQTAQPSLPQVLVATVARGDLNASVSSNGKVEPIEPHSVQARFSAFIEQVFVKEGEAVRQGQPLVALNAAELQSELARLRQELAAAEEDLRTAQAGGRADEIAQLESDQRKTEAELARLRRERGALDRLLARQAATPVEIEQNQTATNRAEADLLLLQQKKEELARRARVNATSLNLRIEETRQRIQILEERIKAAQVRAPAGGVIYSLPARAGSYARVGDLLAELADLSRVRVRVFVDEPELGALAKDQEVEITWDAYPNRVWPGLLERLPTSVVPRGARNVGEALCSVSNSNLELLPGINVNVRIHVRSLSAVLLVPRAAVRAEGTRRFVFVARGDRLGKQQITVGAANATRFEVVEGLREGDRVALPGEVELQDGLAARMAEAK